MLCLVSLATGCRKSYGPKFPGGDPNYLFSYKSEERHAGLADVMSWLLPYARYVIRIILPRCPPRSHENQLWQFSLLKMVVKITARCGGQAMAFLADSAI
jgi:hypothetical protein